MQGLNLTGECLGTRKLERSYIDKTTNQRKQLEILQVGVKIPKVGGFDGEFETLSISLSKIQQEANLQKRLDTYKNKIITLPVYIHAYASNGSAGYEIRLSGDGLPLE